MPRYDYILFDADNTLFDFDRSEQRALEQLLLSHGYPTDCDTRSLYHTINRDLWARLDRGEVERDWLIVERFARFTQKMGRSEDPEQMNREYLSYLAQGSYLLPGAEALCRRLAQCCTLAIVTNGVAASQRTRFSRSPLRDIIAYLYISEELGYSKPRREFFDAVLLDMGVTALSRVVVIGDNLLTDVLGGQNAGLDAVWFNPHNLVNESGITPTDIVHTYDALEALILG